MEMLSKIKIYRDGKDTILVFKNASDNLNNVISAIVKTIAECPEETVNQVNHLENLPEEKDELPKFLSEPDIDSVEVVPETDNHTEEVNVEDTPVQEPDIGKMVLSIGKMKGKTIAEVFCTNKGWLQWVIDKYIPRTQEHKKEVDAISKYLKTH